ncbi:MAG: hypothetical protein JNG86_02035, partial [Verrucomicrobiaceae bacterium]|nr:hypothetical protein [Verrucomicrobiaceae bacterium]
MKTIRPYFLCAVALVAFSCATAWLFQQWRLSDRPKFVPPAAAEAPTPEQQKVKQYLQQTQEIGHLEEELRRATLSETKNTVNELRKKIDASKTLRANSFGSVDFTPADLPKRIPA